MKGGREEEREGEREGKRRGEGRGGNGGATGGVGEVGVEVEAEVRGGDVLCSRIAVLVDARLGVVGGRIRRAEDP